MASTYESSGHQHSVHVQFCGDNVIQPWCKTAVIDVPNCGGLHIDADGGFPRYHPETDSFDCPLDTYQDKAELILY